MITLTSVEAQNRFGQLLDMVQREPVTITRHGRAAAFVVSPQDMEELANARARRSQAVEAFEAWSTRAALRVTPEAGALTIDEINQLVHEQR